MEEKEVQDVTKPSWKRVNVFDVSPICSKNVYLCHKLKPWAIYLIEIWIAYYVTPTFAKIFPTYMVSQLSYTGFVCVTCTWV